MGLALSRHCLISKVRGSQDYYILNLLSGNADVLSPAEANAIQNGRYDNPEALVARGYLVDPAEEEQRYRHAFLDFTEEREREELQLFFAPTYACNFACDYCFQSEYAPQKSAPLRPVLEAFFAYIDRAFAGRRKYLTLFGGEPLLPSASSYDMVGTFIAMAAERNLDVAVVTNGYHLIDYLPTLTRGRIREIQVTLDGLAAVHDRRRPLKGGGPTFERIVGGIDAALQLQIPINLRVVVDRDNIDSLPQLASFAIGKGWTRHPRFKTQLGRNYELHSCQADRQRLLSRLELAEEVYALAQAHPEVLELHRPAFSVTRHLAENGELPQPLFDACPGTKTEWAFDATGNIYACTATVGKAGEALGTFYPDVHLDEKRVASWEDRDVLSISECRSCPAQLACGGGCAAVAKNRTGRIDAPDCRPVRELLSLGMGTYFAREAAQP